ncbi:MAG: phage tail assembly protein [Rhodobacter sp.]|nr:phage tail assembly protein [Rhodobacter sp.]MCA3459399.1 phage tail assembly protein [Rhodobacter sp.]MCA3461726.1 phage tail assembly protein [Rhodobacter sp.]MCA3464524.1 phage tail assembly protein [Rhodobacter sp.]MCA3467504.1 phage tail assembly protein [Rhodobacter sp.]
MNKITLQTPVLRKGSDPITEVTVREPKVGDTRGLSQMDIARMDVKTMERLLPRITQPPLLPDEIAGMNMSDFFKLSGAAVGFLIPEADREQAGITE